MKKKIAFVSCLESAPWGGCEELWSQTALIMIESGYEIHANVKYWTESLPGIKKIIQAGGKVFFRKPKVDILSRLRRKVLGEELTYRWLDCISPDFVIISSTANFCGADWMEACFKRGIPYVIVLHTGAEHWWPQDPFIQYARKYYEGARRCFFVSNHNLNLTEKQLTVRLKKPEVVRNPFKVSYDVSLAWPNQETIRLACVARLDIYAKGQDILLEVLRSELWKNRPVKLSLFGEGGNRESLKQYMKLWNVKNITFGGYTNDIEAIWANHHALVLPSRNEGLPIALVEAMLCGRLCIVSNAGGNAELIQDNVTGFVAKAPTIELFGEAMERAWKRKSEWQAMGEAAALSVRKMIPRDPAREFAMTLESFLAETFD